MNRGQDGRQVFALGGRGRRASTSGITITGMAVLLYIGFSLSGAAALPARTPHRAANLQVETALRQAIRLWANERFEALWDQGLLESRYRISRETFARAMRHRAVRPACCWEQIRSLSVRPLSEAEALVETQMGFRLRTLGTTERRTLLFYLRQEEGRWRVALEDFLTKPEVGPPWILPGIGWPR